MSRADLCGGDCACVDVTEVQLKPLRVGECTVHFVSLSLTTRNIPQQQGRAGQGVGELEPREKLPPVIFL